MQEDHIAGFQSAPSVGQLLADRYEIISLIGEGGIGLVYKARHVLMNRLVAIKMIRAEHVENSTTLQRFQQEAQAISKLQHPNIVAVFDFGVTSDSHPYLVMDYLEGTTLADLLGQEGGLSFSRALPLLVQACLALQHAHGKGIIHRDFKSSNIVICLDEGKELVKVVDFGMAKLLSGDAASRPNQELTQAGDVFGSPLYMSPEQCKGQRLDQRSDIYSLGCVMYYALSGKPPIIGENLLDTLQRQINEDPQPLAGYANGCPPAVERVIFKALRKNPDERYQNISDLLTDFQAATSGKERQAITLQMRDAQKKSGQEKMPAQDKTTVPIKRPRMVGHNFELNIVVAASLAALVIGLSAFISGRMFEVAGENQEVNMWAERNVDGDNARTRGVLADAVKSYREAVSEAQKFGKHDPRLAKSLVSLGATYVDDQQYARGDYTLRRAMTILEKCYGPNCPEISTVLLTLARSSDRQGRHDEAEDLRKRALQLLEAAVGSGNERSLQMVNNFTRKSEMVESPETLSQLKKHVQSISRSRDQNRI